MFFKDMRNVCVLIVFSLISKISLAQTVVSNNNLDDSTTPYLEYNEDTGTFKNFEFINVGVGSLLNESSGNISTISESDKLLYKNLSGFDDFLFSNNTINVDLFRPVAGGAVFIDTYIGKNITISNSSFISNSISSNASTVAGGAIANFIGDSSYSLNISNTNFENNSIAHIGRDTVSVTDSPNFNGFLGGGGAIFSTGNLNITNSSFTGNSASADGYMSRGGAIANYGANLVVEDTSFYNNSVSSTKNEAIGGAISNTQKGDTGAGGNVTIIARNKDVVFSGNTMNGTNTSNVKTANDIYNKGGSNLELQAYEGRTISFDSGIDGDGSGVITINNGSYKGTILLNSAIKNNTVNLYGGILQFGNHSEDYFVNAPLNVEGDSSFSLFNNQIGNVNVGNLSINRGNVSLMLDVDLDALTVDSISANTSLAGNKFTISGFNILKDTTLDRATIDLDDVFGGEGTAANALNSGFAGYLPSSVNSPIFVYDLELDPDNYTVDFVKRGDDPDPIDPTDPEDPGDSGDSGDNNQVDNYNPYLYDQTVSMKQLANIQHYITKNILNEDDLMFNVDFTKLILSDRVKYRSKVVEVKDKKTSLVVSKKIFNLVRVDTRSDAIRLASGEEVYGPLATLEKKSSGGKFQEKPNVWINVTGLKDDIKYDGFSSVENDFFTALLGVNTKAKKFRNGITTYGNVYLGYLRGTQKYTDNEIENNAGYVGASAFMRYNDIFTALTANIGFSGNDADNMYGKDDYNNYWVTLSTKFAYNYNIGESGYSLQPSLFLSYVFINADSYNSRSGVRINQDNLNSFQIVPGLKFSKMFKNDLFISLHARYVIELVNDLDVKANTFLLPDLTDDPFFEYGLSLNKTIKDSFLINLELNRRDGGRQGWVGGINAKLLF